MESYTEVHRGLVQTVMKAKLLEETALEDVFRDLYRVECSRAQIPIEEGVDYPSLLQEAIVSINENLHPLDLHIRKIKSQQEEKFYYTLVNTLKDISVKMSTSFSPREVEAINEIIHKTVQGEKYSISAPECWSIVKSMTNRDQPQAEAFMDYLTDSQFFEFYSGFYTLSPRSLAELKPHLLELYSNSDEGTFIFLCAGCTEVVTKGIRCSDILCEIRFHRKCAENYFTFKKDLSCPGCSKEWPKDLDMARKVGRW